MLRSSERLKLEKDLADYESQYMTVCKSIKSGSGSEASKKAKKLLREIDAVRSKLGIEKMSMKDIIRISGNN